MKRLVEIAAASHLSLRARAGVLAIVLFALQSSGQLLREARTPSAQFVQGHEVRTYEDRFRDLRAILPPRSVVGYIADPGRQAPPLGMQMGSRTVREAVYAKRFFLTQYVLAPAILVDDTERSLIVGNFDPASAPAPEVPGGLVLLRDFGRGVMLLARKPA